MNLPIDSKELPIQLLKRQLSILYEFIVPSKSEIPFQVQFVHVRCQRLLTKIMYKPALFFFIIEAYTFRALLQPGQ